MKEKEKDRSHEDWGMAKSTPYGFGQEEDHGASQGRHEDSALLGTPCLWG